MGSAILKLRSVVVCSVLQGDRNWVLIKHLFDLFLGIWRMLPYLLPLLFVSRLSTPISLNLQDRVQLVFLADCCLPAFALIFPQKITTTSQAHNSPTLNTDLSFVPPGSSPAFWIAENKSALSHAWQTWKTSKCLSLLVNIFQLLSSILIWSSLNRMLTRSIAAKNGCLHFYAKYSNFGDPNFSLGLWPWRKSSSLMWIFMSAT